MRGGESGRCETRRFHLSCGEESFPRRTLRGLRPRHFSFFLLFTSAIGLQRSADQTSSTATMETGLHPLSVLAAARMSRMRSLSIHAVFFGYVIQNTAPGAVRCIRPGRWQLRRLLSANQDTAALLLLSSCRSPKILKIDSRIDTHARPLTSQ